MSAAKNSAAKAPAVSIPFPEPILVTVATAALMLSISRAEVRLLARRGLITHKKLGKTKWLISTRSLHLFADGRAA